MSKTKGNSEDPIELVKEYGSDALRFSLVSLISSNRRIKFDKQCVEKSRNFLTKIKNVLKFFEINNKEEIIENLDIHKVNLNINKWIIYETLKVTHSVDEQIANLQINTAAENMQNFIWNVFCDWYIELSKTQMCYETRETIKWCLLKIADMIEPITPEISVEINQKIGTCKLQLDTSQITCDTIPVDSINSLITLIKRVRSFKAILGVPHNKSIKAKITGSEFQNEEITQIEKLANVEMSNDTKNSIKDKFGDIIIETEIQSISNSKTDLELKLSKIEEKILRLEAQIKSKDFVKNAPIEVLLEMKNSLEQLNQDKIRLDNIILLSAI